VPEPIRQLVSGVAAEPVKSQRDQVFHDVPALAVETFRIARVAVVELGQILPDHLLLRVKAGCVGLPEHLPDLFLRHSGACRRRRMRHKTQLY